MFSEELILISDVEFNKNDGEDQTSLTEGRWEKEEHLNFLNGKHYYDYYFSYYEIWKRLEKSLRRGWLQDWHTNKITCSEIFYEN